MKRHIIALAVAVLFLTIAPCQLPVSAKDTWTGVQSKNFFLIGNADEKQIKQVATRLEQFRDAAAKSASVLGHEANKFKQLVEQYTNGNVHVDVYPNGTLFSATQSFQAVTTGSHHASAG